jgi:glycosyltransferase involved in cell wall biosynthesis
LLRPSSAKQRITMLLENNPYPQDVRVRSEAQSLAAAGYQVEVVAPRSAGQAARERVHGVDVRRFRAFDGTGHGLAGLLLEYLVAIVALHAAAIRAYVRGATVLHIHNPPDTLFLAGAMFRLGGRRVVFDHHDLGPELVAVKFRRPALIAVARISERLTFAAATHVLAANESHATVARQRGHMEPGEVTVVRNGPPASWTRLPLTVRPGRLSPIRLTYVGAVAEQDGVVTMAEVLARLRDRTPPVPALLTVVGDGDGRPSLEAALRRLGLAESVTFTGWVEAERVTDFLADADACVDPAPGTALNERSTMIKLAEYLALGKPVVAFDLLETRRTVAGAAMLAPEGDVDAFADRIARIAEDPELRSGLAQRARERAGELTWEHSETALLSAYAGFDQAGEAQRGAG